MAFPLRLPAPVGDRDVPKAYGVAVEIVAALAGIVALACLTIVGGWASSGLPVVEAAIGAVAAARQVGPATRARRRLETSRRDDDHAAS